ncbi:hypothetical protein [Virgibacillus pantothenticus]|nr:hypothetical protein [Virgibacillus pantothenticus]
MDEKAHTKIATAMGRENQTNTLMSKKGSSMLILLNRLELMLAFMLKRG